MLKGGTKAKSDDLSLFLKFYLTASDYKDSVNNV